MKVALVNALAAVLGGTAPSVLEAAPAVRMLDLDGDGALDRLETAADGTLSLAMNRGGRRFEEIVQELPAVIVVDVLAEDLDGDGYTDLYLVSPGQNAFLLGDGTGRFVEATAEFGLADGGVGIFAERVEIDSDGTADVLLHNAEGDVIFWGTPQGVYERDPSTPPAEGAPSFTGLGLDGPLFPPEAAEPVPPGAGRDEESRGAPRDAGRSEPGTPGSGKEAVQVGPMIVGTRIYGPLPSTPALAIGCAKKIEDATTGNCLKADSTPTLGRLYPLGPEFNIDAAGNVGIGTTSPAAKLDVAGSARMADTLTLSPSGDQALNVSTGSIYKGGSLFIHTKGGSNTALGLNALTSVTSGSVNTASGVEALGSNTTGFGNTASGFNALRFNTTGSINTASGAYALGSNTTGLRNTASGFNALRINTTSNDNTATGAYALRSNTTGAFNTASGASALRSNTTGLDNTASGAYALGTNTIGVENTASGSLALRANTTGSSNTADGSHALRFNTTGSRNVASGFLALYSNTTGNNNTAIGNQALLDNTGHGNIGIGNGAGRYLTTGYNNIAIGDYGVNGESQTIRIGNAQSRAFIAGIRATTTAFPNAIPVLVDSFGQLGTVSSSRRFKQEIRDMGETTERLLELRPVVFRYKQHVESCGAEAPLEYGLIAEEVAEVFPDLVVYDEENEPLTVKYHLLSSMLLNELQELHERLTALERRVESPQTPPGAF